MAIREIVTPPNQTLRKRAQKVHRITPEIDQLIDDLIETMRVAPGVGLAAPQIDVGMRVIIVEYAEDSEDPDAPEKPAKLYAVINPEITRTSKERVLGNEACLSLPGYFGEVERYERVTVKGLNRHGQDFKLRAKGWLARIFQHEIDHIEGILYIDRATQIWRVEEKGDEELPAPA
ncbi:MAG: peptide deformylase [Anaerolineales bacterium]|nr:peptide deformylase [Anaerolineales bacterium]